MGRFTIFSLEDCPHCKRTKGAFDEYSIPYTEINLSEYPDRRNDMLALSDRLTVPQVFLNETHVGGADETLSLLKGWATDEDWTPVQQYQNFVKSARDPKNTRLRPSTGPPTVVKETAPPPRDEQNAIALPDNNDNSEEEKKTMTVLEMTELLKKSLPSRDLKHHLTAYKNAFRASELVDTLMNVFSFSSREKALEYGRDVLQNEHGLLGHVVDDHPLQDTQSLFFRLTCHQKPDILNSYRRWTERVDPDPLRLLNTLKKKLTSSILSKHTDQRSGKVNYMAAYKDPEFPGFEEAACELQGVDIGAMTKDLKLVGTFQCYYHYYYYYYDDSFFSLIAHTFYFIFPFYFHLHPSPHPSNLQAFCINLYNFMIKYAFCKVGVGTTDMSRYSFFTNVQFQVGDHVFSFQDLENGVLRGNRKAPYSMGAQFSPKDPRLALSCKDDVDCRIHFALNCGAASCPPIKTFTADSIDEELRIVALAFCEDNVKMERGGGGGEVTLSKILNWYQEDFGNTHKELVQTIVQFTRGKKQVALQSMLTLGVTPKVKFAEYDWSTDASEFVPFSGGNVKANSSRFVS
jgi:glutaredoxin